MLGSIVEVLMKNILSPRFFEGPNHFGMPRGNKILALNEPNRLLFLQIQRLPPSMHKWKEIIDCIKKTSNGYDSRPTPDDKSH